MLSILIPIYNFDVRQFVNELHLQAAAENIEFEIILADDASDFNFRKINKETENLKYVKYIQLKENIGRSKIRNFLAEQAKFEYFLFADCDMKISNNQFLKKYLININKADIICGGIKYDKKVPQNSKYFLRWYFGKKREEISAESRNFNPYASFMSGIFLIKKTIFSNILFNENLSLYGHEDTLFGIELKRKNIKILHIDNPLIHIGLESAEEFITKTEKGIQNLIFISKKYNYPEIFEEIKLLKISKKIYKFRFFILFIFKFSKKLIIRNLKSNKPKLFLFDFYKLGYFYQKINKFN